MEDLQHPCIPRKVLRPTTLWTVLSVLFAAATGMVLVGCSLFDTADEPLTQTANRLPPIPTPRNSIHLEIAFIQRPVNDPLLGKTLWREVDQIGALKPRQRTALRENGFQVGHVGATPPQALQTLLGLRSEIEDESDRKPSEKLRVRRVAVTSGGETQIRTSTFKPHTTVTVFEGDTETEKELDNARCLFRVRVEREQDGWATLQLIPEIHNGQERPRHQATPDGWQLRNSQAVEPFYGQRFRVNLSLGEMLVITADPRQSGTLGHEFFINDDESMQQMLVLRLANMRRIDPVYAE